MRPVLRLRLFGRVASGYNAGVEFYFSEVEKDVLIISADGGIDRRTSGQFVENILSLIQGGITKIIVDLDRLTYISSYGLGVVLRIHKRARAAGGEVKLANVHSSVAVILNLTGLNTLFGIYPDVNRARLEFRPKDEDVDSASDPAAPDA